MKILMSISICLFLQLSVVAQKHAQITGKLIAGDITQVDFRYINDNPISYSNNDYTGKFENGTFSIQIPIERLANGLMQIGNQRQDICLFPGDNITVEIDNDSIVFKGKGANKNSFLATLKKRNLTEDYIYGELQNEKLDLDSFSICVDNYIANRKTFLSEYSRNTPLEKDFINYFLVNTKYARNNALESAKRFFCHKNKVSADSVQWPKAYDTQYKLPSLNDENTKYSSYNYHISYIVYRLSEQLSNQNPHLNQDEAQFIILKDSLSGKTQSYAMASEIEGQLSQSNYNAKLIDTFNKLDNDELATSEVQTAIMKYETKQAFIGKPIPSEMAQALVVDSTGTQTTFGEIMKHYKGKAVYLDIWSLGCGPCRTAMPHSKKLKTKLANEPIEFVYITVNRNNDKLWQNLYKVSQTKQNHYCFVNGFNSSLHKFMEISWVPCYMTFDKNGNLANYSAERPTAVNEGETSNLEKELRALL